MSGPPVVIFGDHIAAFGVIRSLAGQGLRLFLVSPGGTGLATRSRFLAGVLVLGPAESTFADTLFAWLRDKVGPEAVLMVAGDDYYLDVLASLHDRLLPNYRPTFPPADKVLLVREKQMACSLAQEVGVPVPETTAIASREELARLVAEGTASGFPLLMRAMDSKRFLMEHGTKGIVCHSSGELLTAYDTYNGFYGRLLLQEMIPGGEEALYNYIGIFNAVSDPIGVFMNRKRRSEKQFLSCTLMETMWSDEIMDLSHRLIKKIGYTGYANLEYKYDYRDGRMKFLEINGRISLSHTHALRCGINLPLLMYREALEGPLPSPARFERTYGEGILWWYLEEDLKSAIRL